MTELKPMTLTAEVKAMLDSLIEDYYNAEEMRIRCARNGDKIAAMYWYGERTGIGYAIVCITGEHIDKTLERIKANESDAG